MRSDGYSWPSKTPESARQDRSGASLNVVVAGIVLRAAVRSSCQAAGLLLKWAACIELSGLANAVQSQASSWAGQKQTTMERSCSVLYLANFHIVRSSIIIISIASHVNSTANGLGVHCKPGSS